jgi:hypothetical protein
MLSLSLFLPLQQKKASEKDAKLVKGRFLLLKGRLLLFSRLLLPQSFSISS